MTSENQPHDIDEMDLAEFDDAFSAAEVESREPVPDGKYQVAIEKVELTRARTSGQPMLRWMLRVLNGPFGNRCLFRHNMIVTPENMKWLKTDLHTCGLKIERLSDLPTRLEQLLDVKLEVTKRTKGENENVYLNRRIEINVQDNYERAAHAARGQL